MPSPWYVQQKQRYAEMSDDDLFAEAYSYNGTEPNGHIQVEVILNELEDRIRELRTQNNSQPDPARAYSALRRAGDNGRPGS